MRDRHGNPRKLPEPNDRDVWQAFIAGFLFCLVLVVLSGCASQPSHNTAGGYINACGDLPGMLGDDC